MKEVLILERHTDFARNKFMIFTNINIICLLFNMV